MSKKDTVSYILVATLMFLCIGIWYVASFTLNKGLLTVSFLNVGQGDAIYIEAPNGTQTIIDGGPDNSLLSELGKVMPFYDKKIDVLIVTNPDKDHFAGFVSLLRLFKVDYVFESGTKQNTQIYKNLEEEIKERNIPKYIATRGQKIILDEKNNAYIEILYPEGDVSNLSSNDGSIVAKLVYASTSVMLQGDSTKMVEYKLLNSDPLLLDADILKVGHHGSKTSTAGSYVKAVTPDYAVISLGEDNSYGHPHKDTLDTLNNSNIPVLRTDIEGRITFVSDGERWERK